MEVLFPIIVLVVVIAFSLLRRVAREEEKRQQPKWPGPVAPPGIPGFPLPAPPQPRTRTSPPRNDRAGEGVATEGVTSMEWAASGESVEQEATRFNARVEGDLSQRLGSLEATEAQSMVQPQTGPATELQGALSDRNSLAQAFVLSEVLGKPKALRRRGNR